MARPGRPSGAGQVPIDPVSPTDPKADGFTHTQAGRDALDRIKNYFLNVAQWLGAPAKQRCMFMRATWGFVVRYPLAEALSPKLPVWELGGYAKDAIGRRASQCVTYGWLRPIFPDLVRRFELEVDWEKQTVPRLGSPSWEAFETIVLGGITRAMLEVAYDFDSEKGEMSDEVVAKAMAKGLTGGVKEFDSLLQESREQAVSYERDPGDKARPRISAKDFLPG